MRAKDVMTSPVITVEPDVTMLEAIRIMLERRISGLPVTNSDGIVTCANLLHALLGLYGQAPPTAPFDDSVIRTRLLAELAKEKWAPVLLINPIVHNGVVELFGSITDERERKALVVAAENIPGVKAVRDHLAWLDLASGTVLYSAEQPAELKA